LHWQLNCINIRCCFEFDPRSGILQKFKFFYIFIIIFFFSLLQTHSTELKRTPPLSKGINYETLFSLDRSHLALDAVIELLGTVHKLYTELSICKKCVENQFSLEFQREVFDFTQEEVLNLAQFLKSELKKLDSNEFETELKILEKLLNLKMNMDFNPSQHPAARLIANASLFYLQSSLFSQIRLNLKKREGLFKTRHGDRLLRIGFTLRNYTQFISELAQYGVDKTNYILENQNAELSIYWKFINKNFFRSMQKILVLRHQLERAPPKNTEHHDLYSALIRAIDKLQALQSEIVRINDTLNMKSEDNQIDHETLERLKLNYLNLNKASNTIILLLETYLNLTYSSQCEKTLSY
jgi:hypothetical protein